MAFAVVLMQAPAFTSQYAAVLLQLAQEARRDIDQREASARQFYAITAEGDQQFLAALKKLEPSNAETLALSIERAQALQKAYDGITGTTPLLRPVAALRDKLDDAHGYKGEIWRTLLGTYDVQLSLTAAAAVYGVAGLLIGSFVAQVILSLCRGLVGATARP